MNCFNRHEDLSSTYFGSELNYCDILQQFKHNQSNNSTIELILNMTTAQIQVSMIPKPPPYNDPSKPFQPYYLQLKSYVIQSISGSDNIFKLGNAFHLRNLAENKTLFCMDKTWLSLPPSELINRLVKVAEIVDKENPWSAASPFSIILSFHRSSRTRSRHQGHLGPI